MATIVTKVQIRSYRRFDNFTFIPEQGINIIVGGNEAGKSTLLEAMILALTGRVNGVRATEYLNPYWFNQQVVHEFFTRRPHERSHSSAPQFRIDIYLDAEKGELQKLRGVNNMANEDSVGLSIWAHPDPDYSVELDNYFQEENCPEVLPVEYYTVEWLNFAGYPMLRRPKELGVSLIDSRTIQSERGIDYYTRQILQTRLNPKDRSRISVEQRKLHETLGHDLLHDLNKTLSLERQSIPGSTISLQVDQSQSASLERILIPNIDSVPISMAGQGNQSTAKTVLSLERNTDATSLIFIEEPENHLSYTRMRQLISYIESTAKDRQVFITTHSSYVLNRLGLDQITLINHGKPARFGTLKKDTIRYFQKLSGFDTLRLILADLIVIVEGPSDEIVFNRFFFDRFGREPLDCGVDVMSVNGVSFKRCFELAAILDRQLFAIRDNDGQPIEHWQESVASYTNQNTRRLFVGSASQGVTLEPQIENANDEAILRQIFPEFSMELIAQSMQKNKTDSALAIATSKQILNPPEYFNEIFNTLEKFVSA